MYVTTHNNRAETNYMYFTCSCCDEFSDTV